MIDEITLMATATIAAIIEALIFGFIVSFLPRIHFINIVALITLILQLLDLGVNL